MVALGLLLIYMESDILKPANYKQQNEIFLMVFDGRWTVLMCGICATYMGFIYNEGLSVAFDWFGGSGYHIEYFPEVNFAGNTTCFTGTDLGHGLYPSFGNDTCAIGSVAMSA